MNPDIRFFGIPKGQQFARFAIKDKNMLEMWLDVLDQGGQIREIQEAILTKPSRKWATGLLHGQKRVTPDCLCLYVLMPEVSALGVEEGIGAIILTTEAGFFKAEESYHEALEAVLKVLQGQAWDEVLE